MEILAFFAGYLLVGACTLAATAVFIGLCLGVTEVIGAVGLLMAVAADKRQRRADWASAKLARRRRGACNG